MTQISIPNKIVAGLMVVVLIGAIFGVWQLSKDDDYETGSAKIDHLLASQSSRKGSSMVIASTSSPYFTLIGTPIAMYYENSQKNVKPLLVQDIDNPARGVTRFMESYGMDSPYYLPESDISTKEITGKKLYQESIKAAEKFWGESDGVILIKNDQEGYNMGIVVAPLASYLNIPIFVISEMNDKIVDALEDLGVKYSIICGDIGGYKKTMKFDSVEDAIDVVQKVIENGKAENAVVSYIALANPLDTHFPKVQDVVKHTFEGEVEHTETGSSANPGASGQNAPRDYFTIPPEYTYARVTVDTKLELKNHNVPIYNSDSTGDRIYTYIGTDLDEDGVIINDEDSKEDELNFFDPSLAYGYFQDSNGTWYAQGHTIRPMINAQGKHSVQVLASIPSLLPWEESKAKFKVEISVENLDDANFPLMNNISSLAPYLAAFRNGVVLAKPEYKIHTPNYLLNPDCGEPDTSEELMLDANKKATIIKKDLNELIGKISGMSTQTDEDISALANHYAERLPTEPIYIGIISDPNMVPWFYFPGGAPQFEPYEGAGIPGDLFYSDIDMNHDDAPYELDGELPSAELPIGRVTGWDAQDVSALLGRTFFYNEIIDTFSGLYGLNSWKSSALVTFGTEPPVESTISAHLKIAMMLENSGFYVDTTRFNEASRRSFGLDFSEFETYQLYEQSSFIFFCAHGFYYWYVPSAQESLVAHDGGFYKIKGTSGGGAFDVSHVKDMDFGPSIIFGSSCVTGKIDGIPGRNALSQAFLHAGFNTYIGASRLSYGTLAPTPDDNSDEHLGNYLGSLFYSYLSGGVYYDKSGQRYESAHENLATGQALALAKNDFITSKGMDGGGASDTTFEEFNIMGDPAFNPYEPIHEGMD